MVLETTREPPRPDRDRDRRSPPVRWNHPAFAERPVGNDPVRTGPHGPRRRLLERAQRVVDRALVDTPEDDRSAWVIAARAARDHLTEALATLEDAPPPLLRSTAGEPVLVDLADVVRLVVADRAGPHRPRLSDLSLEPATVYADRQRLDVLVRTLVDWLERTLVDGERIEGHVRGDGTVAELVLVVAPEGPEEDVLEDVLATSGDAGPSMAARLALEAGGRIESVQRADGARGLRLRLPAA